VRKGDDLTTFIVPKVMKNSEVLTFRIPKGLLSPVAGKLYPLRETSAKLEYTVTHTVGIFAEILKSQYAA
jgi:hypothetical protein